MVGVADGITSVGVSEAVGEAGSWVAVPKTSTVGLTRVGAGGCGVGHASVGARKLSTVGRVAGTHACSVITTRQSIIKGLGTPAVYHKNPHALVIKPT
jgi:hypothetical protein